MACLKSRLPLANGQATAGTQLDGPLAEAAAAQLDPAPDSQGPCSPRQVSRKKVDLEASCSAPCSALTQEHHEAQSLLREFSML